MIYGGITSHCCMVVTAVKELSLFKDFISLLVCGATKIKGKQNIYQA